jgi:flavin-dependent dehydrogenase
VAALLLARAGVRTILVEQHRFPRDKVCGECLSATGIGVLDAIGLRDRIESAARPALLRRALLHPAGGGSLELSLPRPIWGITRSALDTHLLNAVVGVNILQPARCEAIRCTSTGVVATVRNLSNGAVEQIAVDLVILADGKAALLSPKPVATGDLGVQSHWQRVSGPIDAIELFGVEGHYGGIAPVNGGMWNVSFSVPASIVRRFAGDFDAMFGSFIAQNAALRERLRLARRSGAWHASPLPRFAVSDRWPAGMIPVGNAAAAVEPIGGEGMGLAMRSAQLAVEAILDAHRCGRQPDTMALRRAYRGLWDSRRLACRAIARVLSNSSLATAAVALAHGSPALPRLAMRLIGK